MENEELDNEQLSEIAIELVSYETGSMFDSLKKHYGDQIGLFVSIWNSRLPSDYKESPRDAINSVRGGDGKVEVWSYIEGGMSESLSADVTETAARHGGHPAIANDGARRERATWCCMRKEGVFRFRFAFAWKRFRSLSARTQTTLKNPSRK